LLELQDDLEVNGNVDIEPNLVQEDVLPSSGDDDGVEISGGGASKGSKKFVLHLDGRDVAKQQTVSTGQQIDDETIGADYIESDGLRRRRRGKADDTKSSSEDNASASDVNKWTIEDETPHDTSNNDEEQKRVQSADPINLFGVPPPALKVAQTKSRYAIAYYVEVANSVYPSLLVTPSDFNGR